jgi:hypothetical protein
MRAVSVRDDRCPEGSHTSNALLDAFDLAIRWQVPRSHVYRLSRIGAVPTVKLGRYYRYRLDEIEAFERTGGCATDSEAVVLPLRSGTSGPRTPIRTAREDQIGR